MLTQIPKLDKQGIENGWMDAYTNIFFFTADTVDYDNRPTCAPFKQKQKKTNSLTKEIIRL